MSQLITQATHLVKDACYSPTNVFGPGAWDYHVKKVIYFSLKMADILGADREIVELAAIFHDYASVKSKDLYPEHEIHGATLAREFLIHHHYPADRIDLIANCILNHRGSRPQQKLTKEEICLADADALAHFAAIGSLFYLCFNTHHLSLADSEKWISAKLKRSWDKLSPPARILAKPYYDSAVLICGINLTPTRNKTEYLL